MEKTNRDIRLDIIKGIAIILVVIGHVVSGVYAPVDGIHNPVFKFCYSFHMPLFIFVSGWLTGIKDISPQGKDWVIKKTKRLLVPYIIWTCFKWLVFSYDNGLITTLVAIPLYWYLIVLYLCTMVSFIATRFKRKYTMHIILYGMVIILSGLVGSSNMILKRMVIYFPFYFAGFVFSANKDKLARFMSYRYLWPSIVLYPVSMLVYTYGDAEYGPIIQKLMSVTGISSTKILKAGIMFYNHYIVAIFGIAFIWCIVSFICDKKLFTHMQNILSYIGLYTLQIYILHDMLFVRIFDNAMVNSIVSTVTAMVGSLVISVIIGKFRKLNRILFG